MVEPPSAMTTVMAFSNAFLVRICRAVMPLRSRSTTASPEATANASRRASGAGGAALPGSDMPSASADAGHRVGGVHAAAGALARAGGLLDRGQLVAGDLPGGAGADALEDVDEREVPSPSLPGQRRAGVEEDAGQVQPGGGHQHAGQRLVAAGQQHGAVEPLGEITVSTESAMTSRVTSEACMPSWPIEMPSETEMVPNSSG